MVKKNICILLIFAMLLPIVGCGAQQTLSSAAEAMAEPMGYSIGMVAAIGENVVARSLSNLIQQDTQPTQPNDKSYYLGTWKACGIAFSSGVSYSLEELEAQGYDIISDFYIIFRENGAYIRIQGEELDNILWKTTEGGVFIGNAIMVLENGKLALTSDDKTIFYEKVSTSQDVRDIQVNTQPNISQSNENVPDDPIKESACKLFIEIDFVENLVFSRYNVELFLDGQHLATLPHGKYFTTICEVSSGKHSLDFVEENGTNKGSTEFEIDIDSTFSCRIATTSSGIDVSKEQVTQSITGVSIIMPNTVGMLYSEALESLHQAGFVNISYKTVGNHFIWVDSNWLVQEQNIAPGTSVSKSEDIKLVCISLEDHFKEIFIGKDVAAIQELAKKGGYTIIFQDKSDNNMDEIIKSMDAKAKKDWVATYARQYSFTGNEAVVTIEYIGVPTPSPLTDPLVDAGWTFAGIETAQPSSTSRQDVKTTPKPTKKAFSADYHSSNNSNTAKKGDSGTYAYRSKGGSYYIYIIIDFDEGYVYRFLDGNGDKSCDKVKIDSGNLNDGLQITYHDGSQKWSNWFHFKWKNQPDTLIMLDDDLFEYKFYETNLSNALMVRGTKTITNY